MKKGEIKPSLFACDLTTYVKIPMRTEQRLG